MIWCGGGFWPGERRVHGVRQIVRFVRLAGFAVNRGIMARMDAPMDETRPDTRGGDDLASRAHAEAIHRAAVAGVMDELVIGGAEQRIAGVGTEAC